MDLGERFGTLRFLIHDRDPLSTTAFGEVFRAEGLRIITTLPKTPRMNAICERVIGTLRRELLDRTLILGDRHLALVLREYVIHYDRHRPHQSRQQRPRTSKRNPFTMSPSCELSAENPSWREPSTNITMPRNPSSGYVTQYSSGTGSYRPVPGRPSKHGANVDAGRSRPMRPRAWFAAWKGIAARRAMDASRARSSAEAADTIRDLCWQCLDEAAS